MSQQGFQPVKYVKTLEGNYAHLFQFTDDCLYVVKFYKVRDYRKRELVNEWLAAKLGMLLELPVLPAAALELSERSLGEIPADSRGTYRAGIHLAIPYLNQVKSYQELQESSAAMYVQNEDALAGMLIFDQWLNNNDRSRTNILFEEKKDGSVFFWMIDHGRCFPGMYSWDMHTLRDTPVYRLDMPVYKWASSLLPDADPLYEFAEKIMSINKQKIAEIVDAIPVDWEVTEREKERLTDFLTRPEIAALPDLVFGANRNMLERK
ncbi:HipA family kinase [Metabacillus indicus]|uniref:HipA family kinase n=1 Tax=Metabacillus indicus TaxID=246786 RepID=UPI002492EA73|nr:HipA family kinase [Metabacillus indicus]